jgi:hypothetical protein
MENNQPEEIEQKISPFDKPTIESLAESKAMQRFIEMRKIRPEDFPLLEKMAHFPKNLIIECLHNHFNMYRERSEKELINALMYEKNEKIKKLYETFLSFLKKYDYSVCHNLIRILEGEIE